MEWIIEPAEESLVANDSVNGICGCGSVCYAY